ncbi:MAG: phytoene/squalene synthase family protein [Sphingomonas sp.]|nr:phytoene/squalene synthase family protein [Sphingomonas sp.]
MNKRDRLVQEAGGIIAEGSKSFRFASQLFDQPTREKSWLLYSWCRACDDITDGQTLGHNAIEVTDPAERLVFIRDKTAQAFEGLATGLVPFDAMAVVAEEAHIPRWAAEDHLAGFERDAAGWAPQTESDLLSYCYQVAGAVGVMMAIVMGVRPDDDDTLNRAADLGIAFQLANIARDIVADAAIGRTYLPQDWLEAERIDAADLALPANRPTLARFAARLADMAGDYRASARVGAARLPFRSRWAINSASRIYGAIAERARDLGPRAWDKRIALSNAEKGKLVLKAFLDSNAAAPQDKGRRGLWTRAQSS